ncbi:MAG: hypothetical protein ABGF52_08640, partial [Candidatus Asgardarchaeum sp.]
LGFFPVEDGRTSPPGNLRIPRTLVRGGGQWTKENRKKQTDFGIHEKQKWDKNTVRKKKSCSEPK